MTLQRFCMMLCIGLALVASASFLSRSLDQIQHSVNVAHVLDHSALSQVSVEQAHETDFAGDRGTWSADGSPSDHVGHHHHSGDSGGPLLPASAGSAAGDVSVARPFSAEQELPAGRGPFGAERPPRHLLTTT